MSSSQPEQATPRGGRIRPLLSLATHWRKSAVVATLIVLAGLPVVWIQGRSYFAAESVFQVAPNFQKNLSTDKEQELQSNSQYREFVNHLSRSVLRHDVMKAALAQLAADGVEACLPAESERQCIERLQRVIYILPVTDTYMVRVGLRSTERQNVHKIVNAVMGVFLETTRREQIFGSDDRARALYERGEVLRAEIEGFAAERAELAAQLGVTTFADHTVNPYDTLLAQAREKANQAAIERAQARAMVDAFAAQREAPLAAGRSVMEMRMLDGGLQALRNEVVKRSEELRRNGAGLGEQHPTRQAASAEFDDINGRLQSYESAVDKTLTQNVKARLTASLQQATQVEQELNGRVREIEAQATLFATRFRDAMRLTADIRKREQEAEELRNRLNFLATERNAIGFVRLITPALAPEVPQGIGKTRLLLALLAAAGLAFLALPTLLDLVDRRVRFVGDAERAMGIASAGWLVQADNEATRLLRDDQTRRLASTLLRNRTRTGAQVFAFTSARVGGGATAVVRDLAAMLQHLGSRVLVVEANSLSPSPDGGSVDGLSAVMSGRIDPGAAVTSLRHGDATFDFVPYGSNRRAVERLDRLDEALAHWTSQYEVVLVDVPPLLPSADAELLVDLIGQVFLVVEAGAVSKSDVARCRATLEKLDPRAVGLIVNRVTFDLVGAYARDYVVENITGGRVDRFLNVSQIRLWLQLQHAAWARRRMAADSR